MKSISFAILFSAAVMLGLPWLAVTFAADDAGMALCFLLFFAVDPIFSIAMGFYAGKDETRRWFLPLLTPLLFLAGCWLLFDSGERSFLLYAGIYLLLGCAAMIVSLLISKFIRN